MKKNENNQGFSLVEILVVVAIAASVVLVVSNFGNNITGLDTLVSSELQAKSDVNQSLQIMTEAIQSATVSGNGAYPIDSAGTSSFAFYSDINKDGNVEHVRYFYATGTIYRGVIAPTGTPVTYPTSTEVINDLIDNVIISTSSPLFSYYDDTYTGTQSPMSYPLSIPSIRLVNIAFKLQQNQSSSAQRSPVQYFSSFMDIRILNDD